MPGRSSGPGQEVREEDRPDDGVPEEEVLGPEKRAKGCCNKDPTGKSKSLVQSLASPATTARRKSAAGQRLVGARACLMWNTMELSSALDARMHSLIQER